MCNWLHSVIFNFAYIPKCLSVLYKNRLCPSEEYREEYSIFVFKIKIQKGQIRYKMFSFK